MHPIPSKSLTALLLVPAIALLAGCGSGSKPTSPLSNGTTGSSDRIEIDQQLVLHPEMLDDGGLSSDPSQSSLSTAAGAIPASAAAAIRPLFFWRHVIHAERRFEFAFADTDSTGRPGRALVTVFRTLTGDFNLVVGDSGSAGSGRVVTKPLVDHWVRHVELRRVRLTAGGRPVWRIVAASAARVTARGATAHIESVRVQGADLDTTLTDPLRLFRLRQVLRFAPDTPVTLTVTTRHADDTVLLYAADRRLQFKNNGDGTHTGTWMTPDLRGLRHIGVNALAHGTLFDDAAPYDSQAWMMPYVVTGQEMGDYLGP